MSRRDVDNLEGLQRGINQVANVAANVGSFGLIGFNDEGQLQKGATLRGADEVVGEVLGRNLMREQMRNAEARYEQERVQREKLLEDERKRRMQDDVMASQAALTARNTATGASSKGATSRYVPATKTDFLGL